MAGVWYKYGMGNDLLIYLTLFYSLVFSPPLKRACPPDMVLVPAGAFQMGSNIAFQRPVLITKTEEYCIDRYEYPNLKGEFPELNRNWLEAEELCEESGKRLCTEKEWEKACRGPNKNWYTYGRRYNRDKCGVEYQRFHRNFPSGYFPDCVNEYGVHDMSGGVYEWTADSFLPYPGNDIDKPSGKSRWEKAVRSFGHDKGKESYCSNRKGVIWNASGGYLGFRCCKSFDEQENSRVKDNIWDEISRY